MRTIEYKDKYLVCIIARKDQIRAIKNCSFFLTDNAQMNLTNPKKSGKIHQQLRKRGWVE